MNPQAFRDRYEASAPTKDVFAHGHLYQDTAVTFPVLVANGVPGRVLLKIPHDYSSCTLLQLWLLGYAAFVNENFTIIVRAATCDEDKDTHTQTVVVPISTVVDEYECVDLTTTFATVIGNFAACDMIMMDITYAGLEDGVYLCGLRLRYS